MKSGGICLFHGPLLWNHFSKNHRKIGENQRDKDHSQRMKNPLGKRKSGVLQGLYQRSGKSIRRQGTDQKTDDGHGCLDRHEKTSRLFGNPFQLFGPAVAVLLQLVDIRLGERDDGDLRAGKNRIEKNQKYLQNNCSYHK